MTSRVGDSLFKEAVEHVFGTYAKVSIRSEHDITELQVALRDSSSTLEVQLEEELLAEWNALYDGFYGGVMLSEFEGWNYSGNGLPISIDRMRSWVDSFVSGLDIQEHARVLEVGVGSGAIFRAIRGTVEYFKGTDISNQVIASLNPETLSGVFEFEAGDARSIECEPPGFYDAVILNSVVQCFPSSRYLGRVLRGAFRCLKPGGRVYMGDIRDLSTRWAEAIHIVEQSGTPPSRENIFRRIAGDEQLLLSPDAVEAVAQDCGLVAYIRHRDARYFDELELFRFDATLVKETSDRLDGIRVQPRSREHIAYIEEIQSRGRVTYGPIERFDLDQDYFNLGGSSELLARPVKGWHLNGIAENLSGRSTEPFICRSIDSLFAHLGNRGVDLRSLSLDITIEE